MMNLAVRGIDADIKWNSEGSFHKDELRDLKADFILANPPFNISDWGGDRLREDVRVTAAELLDIPSAGGGEPGAVSDAGVRGNVSVGVRYLEAWLRGNGAVAIDNNVSERDMKRVVLNRKNSLFVGNARGGRIAAILASLTSSHRRHDVDPQLYLTQLLVNLPSRRMSDLPDWLPDRWKATQR